MPTDSTGEIAALFAREVPEIATGTIEIKAIARKPRYRTKLALTSNDPEVDCIGASVGIQGSRIKKIVDALEGERIDLVRWNDNPEVLITNALQPAQIEKVQLYPDQHRACVFVKSDQAALAHGRQDMNRELASRLTGWEIGVEEIR